MSCSPAEGRCRSHSIFRVGPLQVVIDGHWWTEHLPHVIEAVLIGPGDATGVDGCYGNACVRSLRDIHRDFLDEYGLTGEQVPLVSYQVGSGFHPA